MFRRNRNKVTGGSDGGKTPPPGASPTQLNGEKGMLEVCNAFYQKVFGDPVMAVLFEDHEEPHAWRLAAFLTREFGGTDEYSEVRGYGAHSLFVNHHKGKMCPHRGKDAGTHFTVTHRERWLRYMGEACDDVGVSKAFKSRVMGFANHVMRFYGPFWDDREQVATLEAKLKDEQAHKQSTNKDEEANDDDTGATDSSNMGAGSGAGRCPVTGHGSGAGAAATSKQ